jgi:hypothetical protein
MHADDDENSSKVGTSLAKNVMECGQPYNSMFSEDEIRRFIPFFDFMESNYQCAGICELPRKYIFSDILKGKPTRTCAKPLIEFVDSNFLTNIILGIGKNMSKGLAVVCVIAFIGFIFNLCICCTDHPRVEDETFKYLKKSRQSRDFQEFTSNV